MTGTSSRLTYYKLFGQAVLTFTTPTRGGLYFYYPGDYPSTIRAPTFRSYQQTYNAAQKVLSVTFVMQLPNCDLRAHLLLPPVENGPMRAVIAAAAVIALLIGPASAASEPFIGEIDTFAYDFCPRSYAPMNGQLLPITQNTALFSLLGTRFGGNGQTTFALPAVKPVFTMTGEPLVQCIALEGIYPSRD